MFFRLFILITLVCQVMLFAPGCEQVKEYRKRVYYEKGLELYETQQYPEAIDQAGLALALDSEYGDALALVGKCQYEMKDFAGAAESIKTATFFGGLQDDLDLLFLASDAFYRAGVFGTSRAFAKRILFLDPGNKRALYLMALISLRSRNIKFWPSAEPTLQPLLEDKEYQKRAFALLAEFNILNTNYEEAELMLMEHAEANDDWFFVMRMLAEKYEIDGDQQAVIRVYKKILELQPDGFQDVELLLVALRSFGRKEEERQLLNSLIATDKEQIYYKLAQIDFYFYYGELAKAEAEILNGLDQGNGHIDFVKYLIKLYEKTNRYAAAIQVAKDVLGKYKGDVARELEFMNMLARLYYLTENLDMAKVVVRWILDIDRDNDQARFLLARISLDEGRTLLAIAELRGLSSGPGNKAEYDYYLGLAHLSREEKNNAEQSFKDALKKDPLYKPALLELLTIYLKKGFLSDMEHMVDDFLVARPNDPEMLAFQAQLEGKLVVVPEDD